MAAAATVLDRCEAARRRKLPFFGSNAKLREADRRQTLERVAAQRAALSAARIGLPQVRSGAGRAQQKQPPGLDRAAAVYAPGAVVPWPRGSRGTLPSAACRMLSVLPARALTCAHPGFSLARLLSYPQVILSSKIAPRALSGVNSPDPLCARHALALAALVARDAPALFIDHVAPFIQGNLDIFQATGGPGWGKGHGTAAASACPSPAGAHSQAAEPDLIAPPHTLYARLLP
jgi:hypothetical protein